MLEKILTRYHLGTGSNKSNLHRHDACPSVRCKLGCCDYHGGGGDKNRFDEASRRLILGYNPLLGLGDEQLPSFIGIIINHDNLVVSNIFWNFHPDFWGDDPFFKIIFFQMGWFNHQLEIVYLPTFG